MKKLLFAATLLLLVGAGCNNMHETSSSAPSAGKRAAPTRVEDSIFVVDDEPVTLNGGIAVVRPSADSATAVTTKIFGTPVAADLDGDGDADAAVFLTRDNGGSGLFYYAAASINENGEYLGTNAILLGDRVAPQTIEIHDGLIVANYADRKPGEPMTTAPSAGISKYFRLQNGLLAEVQKP